jgi:hypothetical protein
VWLPHPPYGRSWSDPSQTLIAPKERVGGERFGRPLLTKLSRPLRGAVRCGANGPCGPLGPHAATLQGWPFRALLQIIQEPPEAFQ